MQMRIARSRLAGEPGRRADLAAPRPSGIDGLPSLGGSHRRRCRRGQAHAAGHRICPELMKPLIDSLRALLGEARVLTDGRRHGAVPAPTGAAAITGSAVCRGAAGQRRRGCGGGASCAASMASAVVPQGGNTGLCGGATPRGGEVVVSLAPPQSRPRHRYRQQHHHRRGRLHAGGGAGSGGRRRAPVSAVAGGRRHGHHRRQSVHQCRWRAGAALRQRARTLPRPRSRAARRPRLERSARPAQGQHRLRPEAPVHRRRGHARADHRGRSQALFPAAAGGDRLGERRLAARPPWPC